MIINDPVGQAVHQYHFKRINRPVIVHCDEFDDDEMVPSYLFRTFEQMPKLEQFALNASRGQVLDVGACAGCHAVWLQKKGLEVTALEQSALCCSVLNDRGIKTVVNADFYQYNDRQFDTILLLMNGTGIAGTLDNLPRFLDHIKKLLSPNGQILIDSSDLIYLYTEEDGSALVDLNAETYYGELIFQTEYDGLRSQPFPWLYVGLDLMKSHLAKAGLAIDKIEYGEHYDYLLVLKHAR